MKRLGLAVVIVAVLVFGIEGILALIRQRNVNVVIEVQDRQQATPALQVTPSVQPSVLTIRPDSTVVARIVWDYRIGPRFPETIVRAEVIDQATSKTVSSGEYKIDCGTTSLNCEGSFLLPLNFGVQNNAGTPGAWPVGDYRVQVSRTFVGFKPVTLTQQTLQVAPAQTP